MSNLITPNDLGEFQLADRVERIDINSLVSEAQKELKLRLVEATIESFNSNIKLTITKTRFAGKRLWFLCPQCNSRKGVLFRLPNTETLACRTCLGIKYRKQRFKGMLEYIS